MRAVTEHLECISMMFPLGSVTYTPILPLLVLSLFSAHTIIIKWKNDNTNYSNSFDFHSAACKLFSAAASALDCFVEGAGYEGTVSSEICNGLGLGLGHFYIYIMNRKQYIYILKHYLRLCGCAACPLVLWAAHLFQPLGMYCTPTVFYINSPNSSCCLLKHCFSQVLQSPGAMRC